MRESIVRPIEAGAVTLIGAGVAYFVLPPSLGIRHGEGYVVDQLINMIWGAVFGAAGYFCVSFAARRWGMAMFRFSIREIILVTIIVALICGWDLEHNEHDERFWKLFNENVALRQKLDAVAPDWRQSQ